MEPHSQVEKPSVLQEYGGRAPDFPAPADARSVAEMAGVALSARWEREQWLGWDTGAIHPQKWWFSYIEGFSTYTHVLVL